MVSTNECLRFVLLEYKRRTGGEEAGNHLDISTTVVSAERGRSGGRGIYGAAGSGEDPSADAAVGGGVAEEGADAETSTTTPSPRTTTTPRHPSVPGLEYGGGR